MPHLDVKDWQELLPAVQPQVLRHLVDCPRCRRRLTAVLSQTETGVESDANETWPGLRSLVHSLDFGVERRRRPPISQFEAQGLFDELIGIAPEYRFEILETAERFHNLGVAELLLSAADEAAPEHPLQSHHLAALAVAVLEHLESTTQVRRHLATAYCLLADAERRRASYETADDHLANAVRHLAHDPILIESRARLSLMLGQLRQDQRRTDEALALYDRSRRISEELAQDSLQAQAALALGSLLFDEGEPEEALPLLWEAFQLAESDSDPTIAFAALHTAALASAEADRTGDLASALTGLDLLRDRLQHPLDPLRFAWSRARIDWQRGDRPQALAALESVFLGLIQHPAPVEAARAGVELALRSLEAGAPADRLILIAEKIAEVGALPAPLATATVFALRLPARAPNAFYMDALEAVADYLPKAQFNPELRYFPLSEPDLVITWEAVSVQERHTAAEAAAVSVNKAGEPSSTMDLHLVCWAHEALTGVRVELPHTYMHQHPGQEDDTWPS